MGDEKPVTPNASETARAVLLEAGGESSTPSHGGARPGAGRKPGSKTKKKAATKKAEEAPAPITEAEIRAYTMLAQMTWRLAEAAFKLKPIDDEEAQQLGEAIAPVAQKYAPALGQWMPEFNLVVVLGGLVLSKLPEKKKPESESVETNGDESRYPTQ